jgi:hypothetical protein
MIAKAMNDVPAAMIGATKKTSFLQRQLERVGDRLQQAPRPGPVGPRPVLHPTDDPALEPDHEDRGEDQEHEDDPDLQQHQPPGDHVEIG